MEQVVVNVGIWLAYALIIIGALLAIVFPLIQAASEPKQLVKSGIGVLGIVVLFGLGYLLSDGDLTTKFLQSGVDTEGLSRMIGGMLKMVYLLMGATAIAILYTEFHKVIK
jgi:hypothetical protein